MNRNKLKLKKNIKKSLIMIAGCLIIIIISLSCYHLFFKQETPKPPVQTTTNEDQKVIDEPEEIEDVNNVDILAIGNSDLYSAFNSLQLWHEQGYTSFAAAAPKQNTKLSYYMLKEVLTVQKPKLLILEADAFFDTREQVDKRGYSYTAMRYCYPLFMESDRWDEIKNESYVSDQSFQERMEILKGYYYEDTVVANTKGFSYMSPSEKKEKFPSYTKQYLPKIIDLANENDCKIMFVCYPSETSWSYAKHNTVNEFAIKYDIPYIDFNTNQYDTGFNWKTDSRDGGNHLNYSGASKVTKYLGQYIQKQFAFKNHSTNSHYKQWNENYDKFIKEVLAK